MNAYVIHIYLKKTFSSIFVCSLSSKSGPSNDSENGNKKAQKISEDIQDFDEKLRFTRPCHDKGGVISKFIFKITSKKWAKSLFLHFSTKSWKMSDGDLVYFCEDGTIFKIPFEIIQPLKHLWGDPISSARFELVGIW